MKTEKNSSICTNYKLETINEQDVLTLEQPIVRFLSKKSSTIIKAAWGSCSACNCGGFMQNPSDGSDYVCFSCGHHWSMHY